MASAAEFPINQLILVAENLAGRRDMPADVVDWASDLYDVLTDCSDQVVVNIDDLRLLSWACVDEDQFLMMVDRSIVRRRS